ncbi:MAG: glycosyltransferase family 39 protein [Flavobacteriales bacterium]|nr:glycosyltransferase family 39 protein [Flavobacteriales bacterium]
MGIFSSLLQVDQNRRFYPAMWGFLLLAYILGLFVFPMDIDSAQYAAMSMEMWQNQSFLEITNLGKPYLDKPPLIFWLSSLFMGVLGFYSWAFKLPTLLSTILGIYSVYRLTQRLWGKDLACNASTILASSVAWLVFNNDVRTDALLANFVIFSCWQFVEWYVLRKNIHFVTTAIGISLAMMAKGPIGAVAVSVFIFFWMIFHNEIKSFIHVRWIVLVLLIGFFLFPMLWGLFKQHSWYGIRFYFWTQSFGRVTGESQWVNHPGFSYFFPILAWSFLPWTPFLIGSILAVIIRKFYLSAAEKTLLFSSILLFVALSLSRYKLPHYIFIILPWLAILVAKWIKYFDSQSFKKVNRILIWILFGGINLIIPWLILIFLPKVSFGFWICWIGIVCMILYFIIRWKNFVGLLAFIFAGVFVILNGWVYPHLLSYQGTSEIGKLARKKEIQPNEIRVSMAFPAYALTFAYQHVLQESNPSMIFTELDQIEHLWIICDEPRKHHMMEIGIKIIEENRAEYFPITRLKPSFICKHSREKLLQPIYLCKVTR